ncbi:MAG: insulinase family protein [Kofleriaceae bacterium]
MRRLALLAFVACSSPGKPPTHELPPLVSGSATTPATPVEVAADLGAFHEGAKVHGFTVAAVYLDDADHPIGAKLVHDKTGFQLDYLRIESAPQGYIWAKTYPTSDQGEPHTQEHLLLGKGERGRRLGSSEAMALATSSAFTEQWHTAYHFHTVAGPEVYWSVFENHLDTLLNPDYTDEEIRREVRNFGVDKADNGTLRLEEKGTVYNEMVRAYEQPETNEFRTMSQLVYGVKHPLALDAGGFPDAIRTMTPADIRRFHEQHYHLANMGMIAAYPSSMPLASVLDHTAQILDKEAGRKGTTLAEAELPKPAPAALGTLAVTEFPDAEATTPGHMLFAWPVTPIADATERTLLELFADALAGDESTPLYQQLIDGKTHTVDLGATGLTAAVWKDLGESVTIAIDGVKSDKLDERTLAAVRTVIMAELAHLAKLPDGDPELVAFDQRVEARVVEKRRELAKFLDSPPRFGDRGTTAKWFVHLHTLAGIAGFAKSITMKPTLAAVDQILAGRTNPWRDRIAKWGLTTPPFGVAAKPSPELRKRLDAARDQRIADELSRLQAQYKTPNAAATLARYQTDYDAATPKAQATELPPLVATPPMTLDDSLKYETGELGPVRTFTATFDSMQSARVELSFDLAKAVAPEDQMFLAGLPQLLSRAGVIENKVAIGAAEMTDRLRNEVLALDVKYIGNNRTLRSELAFVGQGLGTTESTNALAWIRRVMLAPDWRIENLPRLRDIVDQARTAARGRMQSSEETWIHDPADAWWHQDALQAHTASFLTQAFDLHRLRWMLEDPLDPKVRAEAVSFLDALAAAKTSKRAELVALVAHLDQSKLAAKLSPGAQAIARDAGKDLGALLGDVPDESLANDWAFLCHEMAKDLAFGAPAALAKLEQLRAQIVRTHRARLVETGSTASQQALAADLKALVDAIPETPTPDKPEKPIAAAPKGGLRARLAARLPAAKQALFVGLIAPSTSSGVFVNLAPSTQYADDRDPAILDYLASNLYTGHGAHSIFMKTWSAGLAYSNGLHPWLADGYLDYSAERCPLLPQTIRFVIEQLKKEQPDPNIARYAVANAFDSRIAEGYEGRAAAMAANLVDGIPPDLVRAFRTRVLEQSKRDDLAKDLYARMPVVYGKVLPGLGKPSATSVYFVIGNAKQLAAYQDYLHAAVARSTTLFTLYPRDFWLP